jgi:hypothetical protein
MTNEISTYIQFFPVNFTASPTENRRPAAEKDDLIYVNKMKDTQLKDPTAVAVYDGQRKAGNLKRDSAKAIHEVITANKSVKILP